MKTPIIPNFTNEAEEARWWYENRDRLAEQFQQAARERGLKQGSTVLQRIRAARGPYDKSTDTR